MTQPLQMLEVRHLQLLLLVLCCITSYISRVNLSVAIIAMTQSNGRVPEFDWSPMEQAVILSSFFCGYFVMNIPASILGIYFSPKRLLAGSFFASSVLAMLTPALTSWGGAPALVALKAGEGLAQAFMMCTIVTLFSKWVPPNERGRFSSAVIGGQHVGTIVILLLGGVLVEYLGWASLFYFSGGIGLAWVALFLLLGADSPAAHPWISQAERDYIENSLPATTTDRKAIPWKSILTSPPFYAVLVAHCGQNWGFWTLLTEMPSFLNSVLGYNIVKSGLMSSLPYLALIIASIPLSIVADKLIENGVTSIQLSRKLWNTVGLWGSAIALVSLGYIHDNNELTMAMYILAVAMNGCINLGFNINHLDLSPNFAGVLMGMTNGMANVSSFLAPFAVGLIVKDKTSLGQWQSVFYISAAVFFIANLVFIVFGKGSVQSWNEAEPLVGN